MEKYSIRRADIVNDKDRMLNMWNNLIQTPSIDRYDYLFTDNTYGLPTSWLLISKDDNRAVGSAGVFPRKISNNNTSIKVGIHFDMMVEKEHRTLGPALALLRDVKKECQEIGYDALLAFPNERSQPVFKRVGFKCLGSSYRWSKVLHSKMKIQKVVRFKPLQNPAALLTDWCMKYFTYNTWVRFRYWRKKKKLLVRTPEGYFSTNDTIHEEHGLQKSAHYLSWRYEKIMQKHSEIMVFESDNHKLFGYIVYYLENETEAVVQDIYTAAGEKDVKLILSSYIDAMYRNNVHSISILYFGRNSYEQLFKLFGFMKREKRDIYGMSFAMNNEEFKTGISRLAWFDGDLDL